MTPHGRARIRRRRWRRSSAAVALGTLAMAGWAFVWEPSRLRLQSATLMLPAWPEPCDGLRVDVLADLHIGSPWHDVVRLDRIVDEVAAGDADAVLLAGDYVIQGVLGGEPVPIETIAAHLAPLAARKPVYAVLGNHDWWDDGPKVQRALARAGVTVLENRAAPLTAGRCRLWIVGIGDLWEGAPDVRGAFAAVPADATALALTHNPDVFPEIRRAALTIAGHTHGGQVALPLVGRPIVPSRFGERFAAGHVVEDGRHLFVSTGLGTSILPVRFRVPPEIARLTLRGAR